MLQDARQSETPARLRMAAADRRALILKTAQRLLFSRGWDDITVADVLKAAGISKGGFYHHFAAKEDLLDGIIAQFTSEALTAAEAVSAAATGDALARFNIFLAETSRWKAERASQIKIFLEAMMRPGNDVQFQRIAKLSADAARPVLYAIIADGVAERTFDTPDVAIAAEVIVALSKERQPIMTLAIAAANSGDLNAATRILGDRMTAEGRMIDRILGLTPGSIKISNPKEYRKMLDAIASRSPGPE